MLPCGSISPLLSFVTDRLFDSLQKIILPGLWLLCSFLSPGAILCDTAAQFRRSALARQGKRCRNSDKFSGSDWHCADEIAARYPRQQAASSRRDGEMPQFNQDAVNGSSRHAENFGAGHRPA